MDLRTLLEQYIISRGIELSEKSLRAVFLDLKAWLSPSVQARGIVQTQAGDYTLVHPAYGEPYHSVSAGSVKECLEKFLLPSGLPYKAKHLEEINLLDIGFGLGYNVAVAIKKLKEINPHIQLRVISFEKELPEIVPPLPEEFRYFHNLIWDNLPEFEKEGISFKLYLGDARENILEVSEFFAHAVFHDGFSPYRNPELWSLEFLAQVKRLMSPEGVWVSYTSSLPVRKALRELGFRLSSTESIGRKRGGTKACFLCEESLPEKERKKLDTSPYAIPFLDTDLNRCPLEILINYRVRVELLKVAQGGLEPPTPRFSAGCSTN